MDGYDGSWTSFKGGPMLCRVRGVETDERMLCE